ncbi:MAG: hypothetical protein QOH10_1119 [Actinomycetota bacterium]|nr:hypothetical protein [Actinomycetota bacterium]
MAFIGVWTFAFWYDANRPSPEPLDRASQRAAAATCRSAVISLSALTPLPPAPSVAERTTRVRREDSILTDLVARLDTVRPTDRDGATALRSFATDWKHLVAARGRYADAVRSGASRPRLVIPVDPASKPVTIRMREYADIHSLFECTPDRLQGEVVEGVRTYPRKP